MYSCLQVILKCIKKNMGFEVGGAMARMRWSKCSAMLTADPGLEVGVIGIHYSSLSQVFCRLKNFQNTGGKNLFQDQMFLRIT